MKWGDEEMEHRIVRRGVCTLYAAHKCEEEMMLNEYNVREFPSACPGRALLAIIAKLWCGRNKMHAAKNV